MVLSRGTRFGPYEILSAIGAGGMGEVYRARDGKLDRDVAIKILTEVFAADPERVARFTREAKTLAALNHPHIAQIYGLEESGGVSALVMELVEGPTLADRIAQGPIPVADALPIAKQIAEALEAAHELGIIHRDLKPANIKVRDDGTVKVLDFGLAKAIAAEPTSSTAGVLSESPTITSPAAMTARGVILGTAAYMPPEQAKGRAVDRRADVWAFGCVLYEMLTGKRAFAGDDVTDTLARVLMKEPDWSGLPGNTPVAIRRLLRRCLEKDRKRRLDSIADARLEIDETNGTAEVAHSKSRPWAPWAISALAILSAVGATFWASRRGPPADRPDAIVTAIPFPEGTSPANYLSGQAFSFAISPDGNNVVFLASRDSKVEMWVRPLRSSTARVLPGTDGALLPFFSPDGEWVGFFADRLLKKVQVSTGSVVSICPTSILPLGGTWNADGTILFSTQVAPLLKVSAQGGTPEAVIQLDSQKGFARIGQPSFLPDGRRFLFWGVKNETGGVYLGSLGGDPVRLLIEPADGAVLSGNRIVFQRGSEIRAQQVDPDTLNTIGAPSLVADQKLGTQGLSFALSSRGHLLYMRGSQSPGIILVVDRSGHEQVSLPAPAARRFQFLRLTPKGDRLGLGGGVGVWGITLGTGTATRLNTVEQYAVGPIWSQVDDRFAFSGGYGGASGGVYGIYVMGGSGTKPEKTLSEPNTRIEINDWSRDGERLLSNVIRFGPAATTDIVAYSLRTERSVPVLATRFDEGNARFSPDGRWISYISDESGRGEAYVRRFGEDSAPLRISTDGALTAMWREDGRELVYLAPDGRVLSVAVALDAQPAASRPLELFRIAPGMLPGGYAVFTYRSFDMSSDGERFAYLKQGEVAADLTLVQNWPALIGR